MIRTTQQSQASSNDFSYRSIEKQYDKIGGTSSFSLATTSVSHPIDNRDKKQTTKNEDRDPSLVKLISTPTKVGRTKKHRTLPTATPKMGGPISRMMRRISTGRKINNKKTSFVQKKLYQGAKSDDTNQNLYRDRSHSEETLRTTNCAVPFLNHHTSSFILNDETNVGHIIINNNNTSSSIHTPVTDSLMMQRKIHSSLYPSDEEKSESTTASLQELSNHETICHETHNFSSSIIKEGTEIMIEPDMQSSELTQHARNQQIQEVEENNDTNFEQCTSLVSDLEEKTVITVDVSNHHLQNTKNTTRTIESSTVEKATNSNIAISVLENEQIDVLLAELREQKQHSYELTKQIQVLEKQKSDVTEMLENNMRLVTILKDTIQNTNISSHGNAYANESKDQELDLLRKEISIISLENVVLKDKIVELTNNVQSTENEVLVLQSQIDVLKGFIEKIKLQNQHLVNELDEFNQRKVSDAVQYKSDSLSLIAELESAREGFRTVQNDNMKLSNTIMECDEKIDRLLAIAIDSNDVIIPNLEEEIAMLRIVADNARTDKEKVEEKYQELLRFVAELDTQNNCQLDMLLEKVRIEEDESNTKRDELEKMNAILLEELSTLREEQDDQLVLVAEQLHNKEVEIYMLMAERERLLQSTNELTNQIKSLRSDLQLFTLTTQSNCTDNDDNTSNKENIS